MNERISIDPAVHHGTPVIRGTRVPVAQILTEVAAGMSFDQVCREYGINEPDIRAAVDYARGLVESESVFVGRE